MNAWHLPDFHREWVSAGLIRAQDLNVNILQDPAYYRIDIAPAEYKQRLEEKYRKHLSWMSDRDPLQRATQGFESAITFMNATDNTQLIDTFWRKTHELDNIRNENILDVHSRIKGFEMNLPHDKFCVLPWISLEASPIGTVRPCCLANDEIVDSNSVKFNLKSANFRDIQNSEYMYQLRQAFLAGKRPATCRKCWAEEDAGRTSKRMHTLDRLKHMGITAEWTHDAKPLMFLDLKLGNICNLKCRICGSWSSSSFAVEEIANSVEAHSKTSFAYQMLKAGRWPRENAQFWSEIDTVVNDIRYIEFTGGEPFMIEEHFDNVTRYSGSRYCITSRNTLQHKWHTVSAGCC
jgi:MoaA/NifB/PqqE/SkfB family radical SAM enzyme